MMNGIKPIELTIALPKVELSVSATAVALDLGKYGDVAVAPPEYETFEGIYTVTPSTSREQILATANKVLTQDIVIKKILYSETSNTAGGETVYIGKEGE